MVGNIIYKASMRKGSERTWRRCGRKRPWAGRCEPRISLPCLRTKSMMSISGETRLVVGLLCGFAKVQRMEALPNIFDDPWIHRKCFEDLGNRFLTSRKNLVKKT